MSQEASIKAGPYSVRLEGDSGSFDARLDTTTSGDGIHEVTLSLSAPEPSTPPEIKLVFQHPLHDVQARWIPATRAMPGLLPEWDCAFTSQMTRDAPVACLYSTDGNNRLTLACSECVLPVEVRAGVHEESAGLNCSVRMFHQPYDPIDRYEVHLRIDTREVPYYAALAGVSRWWEERSGHVPMAVPNSAKVPYYSTWYSFHQSLVVEDVLKQCRLARELGCEAIIVDDGWQTQDTGRGYPFTGDWEPVRLGDVNRFVDALTNRMNTLDLRLLCGKTAVHSDMFMWNRDEPVEAAALQLLNVLFAVPQASVLIDRLSDEHRAMLKFWLGFWREHRDALLDGELAPLHPEAWYPVVAASNDMKRVVAVYSDIIVNPGKSLPDDLYVVNATRSNRIALDLPEAVGRRTVDVFDCQGQRTGTFERAFNSGIHTIAVPPSGLVQVRRAF